jgi:hypothetical protein
MWDFSGEVIRDLINGMKEFSRTEELELSGKL